MLLGEPFFDRCHALMRVFWTFSWWPSMKHPSRCRVCWVSCSSILFNLTTRQLRLLFLVRPGLLYHFSNHPQTPSPEAWIASTQLELFRLLKMVQGTQPVHLKPCILIVRISWNTTSAIPSGALPSSHGLSDAEPGFTRGMCWRVFVHTMSSQSWRRCTRCFTCSPRRHKKCCGALPNTTRRCVGHGLATCSIPEPRR